MVVLVDLEGIIKITEDKDLFKPIEEVINRYNIAWLFDLFKIPNDNKFKYNFKGINLNEMRSVVLKKHYADSVGVVTPLSDILTAQYSLYKLAHYYYQLYGSKYPRNKNYESKRVKLQNQIDLIMRQPFYSIFLIKKSIKESGNKLYIQGGSILSNFDRKVTNLGATNITQGIIERFNDIKLKAAQVEDNKSIDVLDDLTSLFSDSDIGWYVEIENERLNIDRVICEFLILEYYSLMKYIPFLSALIRGKASYDVEEDTLVLISAVRHIHKHLGIHFNKSITNDIDPEIISSDMDYFIDAIGIKINENTELNIRKLNDIFSGCKSIIDLSNIKNDMFEIIDINKFLMFISNLYPIMIFYSHVGEDINSKIKQDKLNNKFYIMISKEYIKREF